MELTFCGAARAVTGSCIHIQLPTAQLLIDCGLQQGHDVIDNHHFPFQPQDIDYVLLTHCHIDHCGRLPLLVKQGFAGPIFMTEPTARLLKIMLQDSARMQENDHHWHKHQSTNRILFTMDDVEATLRQIRTCPYHQPCELQPQLQFTFYDAGHILGSATIALRYTEQQQQHTIVFSGDIGNRSMPIIENPQNAPKADIVIMESTHGDHCYLQQSDYLQPLAQLLEQTFQRGGNVLIPAAAVGRTQELLYYLHCIKQRRLTPSLPDFPVYVDSPLSQEANQLYRSGMLDAYLDKEALTLKQHHGTLLEFSNLHFCTNRQQSQAINHTPAPKVIIAASSTCDSGPICHHLLHNLNRSQCTIILLGNQRRGTLSHILSNGTRQVKLLGHDITAQARIVSLHVRPIHGDYQILQQWLGQIQPKPQQIFLNHGDEEVSLLLAQSLQQQNYSVQVPYYGQHFSISPN